MAKKSDPPTENPASKAVTPRPKRKAAATGDAPQATNLPAKRKLAQVSLKFSADNGKTGGEFTIQAKALTPAQRQALDQFIDSLADHKGLTALGGHFIGK
jgi:hypothetical protein